ncbi:hypothetical protein SDRG_13043 [Saprolegnia diclina VS20]|uniref:Amino acid permease/ SLC12A domain-containing protein n=1 Tax=Saprolegnia diclina (strain VS20) TaxID=1156394 RepID=T0Q6S8_SAPDV|nr:hypothetical protein SDRG_13043 [Saprolegnia diclina VS20]EQC29170.1 hypothetical protein SDRG_13043 [Saprolegnia diclina VS20]|eukprot:XP_008617348.1 hypothetical protein SDRG_13043 [Saprolegnia diclina VS20]
MASTQPSTGNTGTASSPTSAPTRSAFDIWALGITIVIGGQYFSWNAGLVAGFYSYFGALLLMSTAYVTMVLCLAEVSSTLPFAGGAYGISRCSLGFYFGFIIGCCEALEYLAYVATSVLTMAQMFVVAYPSLDGYEPLTWLCIHVAIVAIHLHGGPLFWQVNRALALVSIGLLVLYIIGAFAIADWSVNTSSSLMHASDGATWMEMLPLTAWFFVGVESLNLASDDVAAPKSTIPKGQIACVLTLVVTGFMTYITSAFAPPGLADLSQAVVPLNAGYMRIFHISAASACLLSIPATYATIFGFVYSFQKLTTAIASSKLLPAICCVRSFRHHAITLLIGCSISYAICLMTWAVPSMSRHIFPVCILSASCTYAAQCVGYLYLRAKFKHLPREFTSPLGVFGAVFSLCVWVLNAVALMAFQNDGGAAVLAFLCVGGLLTVYYYGYAKSRQTFSDEERKVLFVAHIAIFNQARAKGKKNKSSGGPSKQSKIEKASAKVLSFKLPSGSSKRDLIKTVSVSSSRKIVPKGTAPDS